MHNAANVISLSLSLSTSLPASHSGSYAATEHDKAVKCQDGKTSGKGETDDCLILESQRPPATRVEPSVGEIGSWPSVKIIEVVVHRASDLPSSAHHNQNVHAGTQVRLPGLEDARPVACSLAERRRAERDRDRRGDELAC